MIINAAIVAGIVAAISRSVDHTVYSLHVIVAVTMQISANYNDRFTTYEYS